MNSEDLSDHAILSAVHSLAAQSRDCSDRLKAEHLSAKEIEHLAERAYQLFRALAEFRQVYRSRQIADSHLPTFDQIYTSHQVSYIASAQMMSESGPASDMMRRRVGDL